MGLVQPYSRDRLVIGGGEVLVSAAGAVQLTPASGQTVKIPDSRSLTFGDALDVAIQWNGTNLTMLPVADDTGSFLIGDGTTDFDVKVFLSASTKYVLFDVGNVLLTLEDVDLHLGDNDGLQFGDASGGDVSFLWDATNLQISPATDDTGSINIGDGTKDIDVKIFLGTAAKYALFDVGNVLLTLEDVDLKLGDNDEVQFGDAAGGDVSFTWNATNLLILPAADDTGAIYFGDGTTDMDVRFTLGVTTDYWQFDVGAKSLLLAGEARLDLSSATIAAANTDGGVIKAGTSSAPVTEDTADMKFMSFYWDNGATSGDSRGIYNRLYITGAGGGGESFRTFTTVNNVAGATAHGGHISLSFGATGSITGLGVASRNTLHLANQAYTGLGGTYAATQPEIWADGATTDSVGITELSLVRCVLGGNGAGADTGGVADIDDDAYLLVLDGGTTASGNIVESSTTEANYAYSLRCKINGTVMYLMAASAVG